jgi:hypothetical protein
VTEPYTLTAPGWPRPRFGGNPVPWVAPAEDLGQVNEGRRLASIGGGICQVCGLSFAYGADAFGFVEIIDEFRAKLTHGDYLSEVAPAPADVFFVDGALLHLDCARLTAVACPHIAKRDDLICVKVSANDAEPQEDAAGTLRPTYPAGDCMFVPWPVRR